MEYLAECAYRRRLAAWRRRTWSMAWATWFQSVAAFWSRDGRWWACAGVLAVVTAAAAAWWAVLTLEPARNRLMAKYRASTGRVFTPRQPP